MPTITGGRLVAKALKQEGVECIFALSGGHVDSIFQGCLDENIRVVDTRHEQAAVSMAEGWARVTGKPGVAVVTAGPGVTNAVTGLWNALGTASPIIVFGGRSPLSEFEWGSLQDMDSLSLARTVTKWARSGYETKRIPEYVSMAFRHALGGRPGPAYLEFPQDILDAVVDEEEIVLPKNFRTTARSQGEPAMVKEAIDLLLGAERPLIIAGSGVGWSQAAKELQEFIEITKTPLLTTPISMAHGCVPTDHPLCIGFTGLMGVAILADVILVIGARLDFRLGYGRLPLFGEDSKWIQIDVEPTEIGRNRPIDIGIIGDAKAVLKQMTEEAQDKCQGREKSPWINQCRDMLKGQDEYFSGLMNSDSVPIHPARLCQEIRDFVSRDATIVVDGGDTTVWGLLCLKSYEPAHLLGGGPTGTLGVGVSFAMAAKMANPSKQVLLLSGDGSFGLNAMEFNTMVRHNLPVVCVICNDEAWGTIMHLQQAKGTDRVVGTELGFVRYDKVIEALGGYGEAVDKPEDIRPALERAFASCLPSCINVRCTSVGFGIPL